MSVLPNTTVRAKSQMAAFFLKGQPMRLTAALLLVTLLFGCAHAARRTDLDVGMPQFATPRDFDPPGTILRVEPSGKSFVVTRCKVVIDTGVEVLPDWKAVSKGAASLGGIFGKIAHDIFPLASDSVLVEQRVANSWREQTTDDAVRGCVDSLMAARTWDNVSKYLMVREAILADSVAFVMDRATLLRLGGEEKVGDAASKAGLRYERSQSSRIVKKFDHRLRIYYKAEQIWPRPKRQVSLRLTTVAPLRSESSDHLLSPGLQIGLPLSRRGSGVSADVLFGAQGVSAGTFKSTLGYAGLVLGPERGPFSMFRIGAGMAAGQALGTRRFSYDVVGGPPVAVSLESKGSVIAAHFGPQLALPVGAFEAGLGFERWEFLNKPSSLYLSGFYGSASIAVAF